jgi:hypothetical protein
VGGTEVFSYVSLFLPWPESEFGHHIAMGTDVRVKYRQGEIIIIIKFIGGE